MKKILLFPLVCLVPSLLAAGALHQWKGHGQIEADVFELKLIILENGHFIALIQVEQVPVAVEGTWTSEDEQIFSLSVKTEKVMDKEIPIREGKLYLVDENSAFLLAEGFGLELTPRKAKRPDKRHDKHEPATSTSLLR